MFTNDNKDINDDRAGSYVSQIGGYKAFVPKPLPPDPPIRKDEYQKPSMLEEEKTEYLT